jgi:hypothetical protein
MTTQQAPAPERLGPIAYLPLRYHDSITDAQYLDDDALVGASGRNTGNFLFRHALSRCISEFHYSPPLSLAWSEMRQLVATGYKPNKIVLSCANWLGTAERPEQSNQMRYNVLRSTNCEIIAVAIGIQAPLEALNAGSSLLGEHSRCLIKLMADRSAAISVRDEITADVVRKETGVKQLIVTGCPSNYIADDVSLFPSLRRNLQRLEQSGDAYDHLIIGVQEFSQGCEDYIQICARFIADKHATYLSQSPGGFFFQRSGGVKCGAVEPLLNAIVKQSGITRLQALTLMRRSLRNFVSIAEWMEHLKSYDLCFGMRLHGTICALQSGCPAMLVLHDLRTFGVAETMQLPRCSLKEAEQIISRPIVVARHIQRQLPAYRARRTHLAKAMSEFISESGLTPLPRLRKLAG